MTLKSPFGERRSWAKTWISKQTFEWELFPLSFKLRHCVRETTFSFFLRRIYTSGLSLRRPFLIVVESSNASHSSGLVFIWCKNFVYNHTDMKWKARQVASKRGEILKIGFRYKRLLPEHLIVKSFTPQAICLGSVAGSVIHATWRTDFEDGPRIGNQSEAGKFL